MSIPLARRISSTNLNMESCIEEMRREQALDDRRLYLYGVIESLESDAGGIYVGVSTASWIVESIIEINRIDDKAKIPPEKRKPIRLYINSPGGDLKEGFALVSAIALSKTPVWTINVGEWCSMAFLIGICGHKRLSMPSMIFLMHEGMSYAGGAASKMLDRADFDKRFEEAVVKKHVLEHSKMTEAEYDERKRVELYMLPEDALGYGFIDEVVTNIEDIF